MSAALAFQAVDPPSRDRRTVTVPIHLPIHLPEGTDPAALPSMVHAIEKALAVMDSAGVLQRADRLAELAIGFVEPDLELVEDRLRRMQTVRRVFAEGDWLSAEQINALQATPPANKAHPASDWKRRGRVFSVNHGGKEYFARYQFDALYQPLPIVKEVLAAFGEVADAWTLAAWFHLPNGWLVDRDGDGGRASNLAPKDALDRGAEVVQAAARRRGSYVA